MGGPKVTRGRWTWQRGSSRLSNRLVCHIFHNLPQIQCLAGSRSERLEFDALPATNSSAQILPHCDSHFTGRNLFNFEVARVIRHSSMQIDVRAVVVELFCPAQVQRLLSKRRNSQMISSSHKQNSPGLEAGSGKGMSRLLWSHIQNRRRNCPGSGLQTLRLRLHFPAACPSKALDPSTVRLR